MSKENKAYKKKPKLLRRRVANRSRGGDLAIYLFLLIMAVHEIRVIKIFSLWRDSGLHPNIPLKYAYWAFLKEFLTLFKTKENCLYDVNILIKMFFGILLKSKL